jgi:hypothetical protein
LHLAIHMRHEHDEPAASTATTLDRIYAYMDIWTWRLAMLAIQT